MQQKQQARSSQAAKSRDSAWGLLIACVFDHEDESSTGLQNISKHGPIYHLTRRHSGLFLVTTVRTTNLTFCLHLGSVYSTFQPKYQLNPEGFVIFFRISREVWYLLRHAVALWHYAKSWKVVGSNPDAVIGSFNWFNPSSRTIALQSTQPLNRNEY
jgi:hypothetical protein